MKKCSTMGQEGRKEMTLKCFGQVKRNEGWRQEVRKGGKEEGMKIRSDVDKVEFGQLD